jgi:hypothetical protein
VFLKSCANSRRYAHVTLHGFGGLEHMDPAGHENPFVNGRGNWRSFEPSAELIANFFATFSSNGSPPHGARDARLQGA